MRRLLVLCLLLAACSLRPYPHSDISGRLTAEFTGTQGSYYKIAGQFKVDASLKTMYMYFYDESMIPLGKIVVKGRSVEEFSIPAGFLQKDILIYWPYIFSEQSVEKSGFMIKKKGWVKRDGGQYPEQIELVGDTGSWKLDMSYAD